MHSLMGTTREPGEPAFRALLAGDYVHAVVIEGGARIDTVRHGAVPVSTAKARNDASARFQQGDKGAMGEWRLLLYVPS